LSSEKVANRRKHAGTVPKVLMFTRKIDHSIPMNFDQDVLEKSKQIPVVVDFWAPWCGPCQTLGPIIEALAAQAHGRWELVKVNTDEQPELMQRYGIRGIPAVKMFVDGAVKDEFTGLLPNHEIEKWLDQNIPDPRMDTLQSIREDEVALIRFIEDHPDLEEAKLALIRLQLFQDPQKSLALAEETKVDLSYRDELNAYKQLATFLTFEKEEDLPVAHKIQAAREAALAHDHQQALSFLIESIIMNKAYEEELARVTCIAYFHYLGRDHEVTQSLRRRFDMALY
jgi:putative thioredoxin